MVVGDLTSHRTSWARNGSFDHLNPAVWPRIHTVNHRLLCWPTQGMGHTSLCEGFWFPFIFSFREDEWVYLSLWQWASLHLPPPFAPWKETHWVKCWTLAPQLSILPWACAFPPGCFLYGSETPGPNSLLYLEGHFSTWSSQALPPTGDKVRGMECHSFAWKTHATCTWQECWPRKDQRRVSTFHPNAVTLGGHPFHSSKAGPQGAIAGRKRTCGRTVACLDVTRCPFLWQLQPCPRCLAWEAVLWLKSQEAPCPHWCF